MQHPFSNTESNTIEDWDGAMDALRHMSPKLKRFVTEEFPAVLHMGSVLQLQMSYGTGTTIEMLKQMRRDMTREAYGMGHPESSSVVQVSPNRRQSSVLHPVEDPFAKAGFY